MMIFIFGWMFPLTMEEMELKWNYLTYNLSFSLLDFIDRNRWSGFLSISPSAKWINNKTHVHFSFRCRRLKVHLWKNIKYLIDYKSQIIKKEINPKKSKENTYIVLVKKSFQCDKIFICIFISVNQYKIQKGWWKMKTKSCTCRLNKT